MHCMTELRDRLRALDADLERLVAELATFSDGLDATQRDRLLGLLGQRRPG